jgi:murein DD-endopeptidase MepM/ murein hydrolase activator NlpD
MIRVDNVDKKKIMNDIIAAQQVQPRRKPSLLAQAAGYHVTGPFIHGQEKNIPRRKLRKKCAAPQPPGFVTGRSRKRGLVFLAAVAALLLIPPVFFMAISFIPDPDPPEEQVRLASYGGFSPLQTGGNPGDIPLDLTETFAWQEYRVNRGDSVEAIAKRFGLSLDAIIATNGIKNVRRGLQAGSKIRIPNMDGIPYTVRSGDSYSKIAVAMQIPLEAILDANDIQSEVISAGTTLFIPGAKMPQEALREALGEAFVFPVRGRQTSPFGWRNDPFTGVRNYHAALDLAAPVGTPVRASGYGRVSAVGYNAIYGNFIIITHADGYQTMYGHLNKILAAKGAQVEQGKIIGQVGSTGRSTGAHLHFAVYKNGRAVNPLELLTK